MEEIKTYYRILNLQPGASFDEVKQAYRQLAFLWHPDRYPQGSPLQAEAEQKFKEINHAYDQLRTFLSQPQLPPPVSTTTKPASNHGSSSHSTTASRPFSTPISHRSQPKPVPFEIPWGWLSGIFFSYILMGGILTAIAIPEWAWGFTWMAWIALAISAGSGSESTQSWLLALIFAGSIAGFLAGYEVGGMTTAMVWGIVGGALGAIAGSEAHLNWVIWVLTVSGVFIIVGLVLGTRTGSGLGALVGGLLGAVVGILLGIVSDIAFQGKRKLGTGSVFGVGLGAWLGAWTGAGSNAVIRALEITGSNLIIGAWAAIAVVAGVISQMVAGEKLTAGLNEFYTFLILATVSGIGLGLGCWLAG